jgi:predicted Fe-Mo cluster-binding NifX family protein
MADTKIIVNCETGEVQELELTAEEVAQREADAAAYAIEQAAREAEAAATAVAKASASAKLAALGLSADEIAALSK